MITEDTNRRWDSRPKTEDRPSRIASAKLNIWAAYVPPEMTEDTWDSAVSANIDRRDMAIEILELRERLSR